MIDHISIAVRDLDSERRLLRCRAWPLSNSPALFDRPNHIGFGKRYPELWLNARPAMAPLPADVGAHIALRAPSPEAVTAFHAAALAAGGTCDGPPGPRAAAMTTYFGAFVRDPDGNRLEAVHFPRPPPNSPALSVYSHLPLRRPPSLSLHCHKPHAITLGIGERSANRHGTGGRYGHDQRGRPSLRKG